MVKCTPIADLLVVDLRSLLAYFVMTHSLPVAGKLPIKTLVCRQLYMYVYQHTHTHTHTHVNSL